MRIRISLAILLVVAALAACAAPTPTPPTATPVPTRTSAPTQGASAQEPEATPVPPTKTPEPTETMTPTATATAIIATRTATAKPTETPQASTEYQIRPDGSTAFLRKDGEWQEIPAIKGLTPSIEEVAGLKTIVYRAEAGNQWGFEAGKRVGVVDPNQYELYLNEQMDQVGGVGLHPKIATTLLWASGFPNQIKICSPVDTTTSWGLNTQGAELILQTAKTLAQKPEFDYDIFLKAPSGSILVVPVTNVSSEKLLTFRVANQPTGWGIIAVGENGVFNELALRVFFYKAISSGSLSGLGLGGKVAVFGTGSFPNNVVDFYKTKRDPPPIFNFNAELNLRGYFANSDGSLPYGNITTKNIVRIGDSFVFPLSDKSPVLEK